MPQQDTYGFMQGEQFSISTRESECAARKYRAGDVFKLKRYLESLWEQYVKNFTQKLFEIIDSFIDGEITDVQCQHCLLATNLGRQYVFVSQKALDNITLLERCFLTDSEKELYLNTRQESFKMNIDKVKLARKQQ